MIKVKLVHPEAKLPTRNNPKDAGADVYSVVNLTIPPKTRALVDTGIQLELVASKFGWMWDTEKALYHRAAPRSGLALKHGIDVFAGVIDDPYRGNIGIILYNSSDEPFEVKVGDKIAQLITTVIEIHDYVVAEELNETSRGAAGYGSSGR
ncbi:MAG TPA: dUTP diphosphatase [Leptospiraceae bacterium]|nr:dUTP diphosphatase [Leptospiraceae bacterium]